MLPCKPGPAQPSSKRVASRQSARQRPACAGLASAIARTSVSRSSTVANASYRVFTGIGIRLIRAARRNRFSEKVHRGAVEVTPEVVHPGDLRPPLQQPDECLLCNLVGFGPAARRKAQRCEQPRVLGSEKSSKDAGRTDASAPPSDFAIGCGCVTIGVSIPQTACAFTAGGATCRR